MITCPRKYAIEKHGDQKYGHHPYEVHLDAVVQNLDRFFPHHTSHVRAAAYLHDVVEDTETTTLDIEEAFGTDVAYLVDLVTDQAGTSRRQRHKATYPRMTVCPNAVAIKICDRIANMESSLLEKPSLFAMYLKEYPYFRDTLRVVKGGYRMSHDPAWEHLDQIVAENSPNK